MAWDVTINGTPVTLKAGSLSINMTANGRSTASFIVQSTDGSYRPPMDGQVLLTQDATRIFGGVIDRPSEKGSAGGARLSIDTTINVADFNTYPERRLANGTFAAGTLKAKLTALLPYIGIWGVTLDPSQVDGPTIPEITYDYLSLSEALSQLCTFTADGAEPYTWSIDQHKLLRATQPSTTPSPFDLIADLSGSVDLVLGDITVEESRDDYANVIIVRTPVVTEMNRVETFTGDGVTAAFTLQYTPFATRGGVYVNGVYETLRTFGDPATWTLDMATRTLTRDAGAPASGAVITIEFDATFQAFAIATDAGEVATYGYYERLIQLDAVPSDTTAQAIADAELAQALPLTKAVRYRTLQPGMRPGQAQQVQVPARNLDDIGFVSAVDITDEGNALVYSVTVLLQAQTNLGGRDWRDKYREWAGDKTTSGGGAVGGGGTSGSGTTVVAVGPGGPWRSVQFNDSGVLGGRAEFSFFADSHSIVMGGGGSSCTEFSESCVVLGYDCHVTRDES